MHIKTDDIEAVCRRHGLKRRVTVIGSDLLISGNVLAHSGADLLVLGEVQGNLTGEATVVIERGATVHGSVNARSLTIAGEVNAMAPGATAEDTQVNVGGRLLVLNGARLSAGKISYGSLQAERGSRVKGELCPADIEPLDDDEEAPASAQTPSQAEAVAPAPSLPAPAQVFTTEVRPEAPAATLASVEPEDLAPAPAQAVFQAVVASVIAKAAATPEVTARVPEQLVDESPREQAKDDAVTPPPAAESIEVVEAIEVIEVAEAAPAAIVVVEQAAAAVTAPVVDVTPIAQPPAAEEVANQASQAHRSSFMGRLSGFMRPQAEAAPATQPVAHPQPAARLLDPPVGISDMPTLAELGGDPSSSELGSLMDESFEAEGAPMLSSSDLPYPSLR